MKINKFILELKNYSQPNDFFDNPDWNNHRGNKVERFNIEDFKPYISEIRTEKSWRNRLRFLNKQIRKFKVF